MYVLVGQCETVTLLLNLTFLTSAIPFGLICTTRPFYSLVHFLLPSCLLRRAGREGRDRDESSGRRKKNVNYNYQ